jgi:hypothetical protein
VSKNPYLTLTIKRKTSLLEKYQQTLTNTCWQIRIPLGLLTLFFSLVTVFWEPDLPLVRNKIPKQRRFGVVAEHFALIVLGGI